MKSVLSFLRPFGVFACLLLSALGISRAFLVFWQFDRVLEANMLTSVLLQGLRFDFVLLGFVLLWPVLLIPIFATTRAMMRAWRTLLTGYLAACFGFAVFLEAATPPFIAQFDSRPNRLFFEYLAYPKEILSTLQAAYVPELVVSLALVSGAVWAARALVQRRLAAVEPLPLLLAVFLTPMLFFACVAMARSTLDHRAVNPSTVALSRDPMVNDLAMNSAYTVLYALKETLAESRAEASYSDMTLDQVVPVVRAAMGVDADAFVDKSLPTLHRQLATHPSGRPKNLVIVLEESLGAEFVGALGGLPLTPRLDDLSHEGIWFENLYATGIRSVRGIEATTTGFTPTPARSVVKLSKSQRNFFTLAELLRRFGYETSFIYGGEAQFDNMRRFFVNNGFEKVVDEKDYSDAVFFGSWGASDEDLFRRANDEFARLHERPFFSLVFTTSNHTPYEFPDGRIELYDEEKNTVNNAVKYADYALGRFFDMAKASPYWNDTIFLIVADHNSRVYGPDLVPIDRFHIPALILGAGIEPQTYGAVSSQIDLPPTLLSLIGISSVHPMIGHDLTRPEFADWEGRAIMQFNGAQAYMRGEEVVVLRKDIAPESFRYDGRHLIPLGEVDPALVELALAHASWSSIAYQRGLFRLPDGAAERRHPVDEREASVSLSKS